MPNTGYVISRLSLSVCLALGTGLALAQTTVPTAYLRARIEVPQSPKGPLIVSFSPDAERCNKAYPERGENRDPCRRQLGSDAQPVIGISLEPKRQGYWRWEGNENRAAFYPAEPWNPSEPLRVNMSGLSLPKATQLSGTLLEAKTLALSARTELSFLASTDPQSVGSLVAQLDFMTAVPDRKVVEDSVRMSAASSAVTLGSPLFLWTRESGRDVGLRIQWPVLSTDTEETLAQLSIAAVGTGKARGTTVKTVPVPGKANLYQLGSVQVQEVYTDAMEVAYNLTFTPLIRTPAAELIKALEIYELPEKLNRDAIEKADWTKAPVVTDETVKSSRRLEAKPVTPEGYHANAVTVQVKATPGRYLLLHVKKGFGPAADRQLQHDWAQIVGLGKEHARLSFMEQGNMLTLSGRRTLTLHAARVKSIRWELSRVRDPYLALTAQDHSPVANDAPRALSSTLRGEIPDAGTQSVDGRFIALKFDSMMPRSVEPGLYDLTLEAEGLTDNPQEKTICVHKRILLSDIGLIAKTNGVTPVVYAMNIATGKPVEGLLLDLVAANGLTIETRATDAAGEVRFSNTKGLTNEREPSAVIARRAPLPPTAALMPDGGKEAATGSAPATGAELKVEGELDKTEVLAWLPISSWEAQDQLYMPGRALQGDELTGTLFTDRTLYRPGDSLHIGVLAKKLGWQTLEAGTPLKVQLLGRDLKPLFSDVLKLDANGIAEVEWRIPGQMLPGVYPVEISAGDKTLDVKDVRVQTFEPESLVLNLTPAVSEEKGWTVGEADIRAQMLYGFGSAAAGRELKGRVKLVTPHTLTFKAWPDFSFMPVQPPSLNYGYGSADTTEASDTITLEALKTDDEGRAVIRLPLSRHLSEMRIAHVEIEGTDELGARLTSAETTLLVSPFDTLLGWKAKNTATPLTDLTSGSDVTLELALIDNALAPKAGSTLTVETAERRYVTELSADDRGYLAYRDTPKLTVTGTKTLTTGATGTAEVKLETGTPGEYSLRIRDASGRVLSEIPYFVAGNAVRPDRAIPTAYMKLKLDKSRYEPGETVTVSVLSPFDGTALLSLESDGVLKHQWSEVKAGQNEVHFKVPENADGQYWLTTSLVRAPGWANRYLKAYSTETVPLFVNAAAHELGLRLEAPEVQSDAGKVTVTLAGKEDGMALLWAVDDALLRPTQYRLTDPLTELMQNRQLMTRTYETIEDLIPEGLSFPGLSPEGGGDEMAGKLAAVLSNPFRRQLGDVAARWIGMVPVSSTPATHTFALPENFQGKVRIMAVGASATRVGAAETATLVRSDLAITPVLPAFAAPGDRFDFALSLTAQKPLDAQLTLEASGALSTGKPAPSQHVTPEKEAHITVPVTVSGTPAASAIRIEAATAEKTYTREATVTVRPAALPITLSNWGEIPAGKTAPQAKTLKSALTLYPYSAESTVSVGTSPVPVLASLMTNFERESAADDVLTRIEMTLPWVLLAGERDLLPALGLDAKTVSDRLKRTVSVTDAKIFEQLAWDGIRGADERTDWFATAMALDYALTLRDRGIPSAADEIAGRLVAAVRTSLFDADVTQPEVAQSVAYVIYELTRAGVITTESLEWLRQRLSEPTLNWNWREDTTALFMAETYRLLHVDREARALMPVSVKLSAAMPGTRAAALYLTAVSLSSDTNRAAVTLDMLRSAPARMNMDVALAAVKNLLKAGAAARQGELPVTAVCTAFMPGFEKTDPVRGSTPYAEQWSAAGCSSWRIESRAGEPLYYAFTESGYPASVPASGISQGISLRKHLSASDGKPVTRVMAGDILTVTLTLSPYQGDRAGNVIVTDLLPAGFELLKESPETDQNPRILSKLAEEDRVVFVVDPADGDTILSYRLRATHLGRFTVPGADARSAATPAVRALTAPGKISVTR